MNDSGGAVETRFRGGDTLDTARRRRLGVYCLAPTVCFLLSGASPQHSLTSDHESASARANYQIVINGDGTFAATADFAWSRIADSTAILSFRTQDGMHAARLTAVEDAKGSSAFRQAQRTVVQGVRPFTFTQYTVPLREKDIIVRYRGVIGKSEGGDHGIPRSGLTYGSAAPKWAVFSLSQLLLLPENTELASKINWQLPPGWASPDWPADELPKHGFVDASQLVEESFNSARVVGQYHEYAYPELKLTVLVTGYESGVAKQLSSEIRQGYARTQQLLRTTNAYNYRLIAVPVDRFGQEAFVEPTYFSAVTSTNRGQWVGQEQTFRDIVQRELRGVVAENPDILGPNLWFLVGIEEFFVRKLCMIAGIPVPSRSSLYARLLAEDGDLVADKETLVTQRLRLKSLCIVESLDRVLRQNVARPDSIDSFLPQLRQVGQFSLRHDLENFYRVDLAEFFSRYVGGQAILPHSEADIVPHPTAMSDLATPVQDSLCIAIVFDGGGHLETCGCKLSQAGGLARLATVMRGVSESFEGPVFQLMVGNSFPTSESSLVADSLVLGETLQYLQILKKIGFDCFVVGPTEFVYGYDQFESIAKNAGLVFASSNLRVQERALAQVNSPRRKDMTLDVIGITSLPSSPPLRRTWLSRNPGIQFQNISAGTTPSLTQRKNTLSVVAGFLDPTQIEKATKHLSPDVVVTPCRDALVRSPSNSVVYHLTSGFLGNTLVLVPTAGAYGVTLVTLHLDRDSRIVGFRQREAILTEAVEEDASVSDDIESFYDAHGLTDLLKTGIGGDGPYVGSEACVACHSVQAEQWKSTHHATAFLTLIREHRSFAARCIPCHVTGSGWAGGYRDSEDKRVLRGVQCEACHGPGTRHLQNPLNRDSIVRVPGPGVCYGCHDSEHSDLTAENFSSYFDRVVH